MHRHWFIIECRGEHGVTMMDEDVSYGSREAAVKAMNKKIDRDYRHGYEANYCIVGCDLWRPDGKSYNL